MGVISVVVGLINPPITGGGCHLAVLTLSGMIASQQADFSQELMWSFEYSRQASSDEDI